MSAEYEKLKARLLARSKWNGECLESTYKPKIGHGYPILKFRRKMIGAHRANWISHNGEIPEGLWVLHKCDNPRCMRVEHLFLGTAKDNTNDMVIKRRQNFKGAMKYSPEIVEESIKMRKNGSTYREISEKLGPSIQAIYQFFRRKSFEEKTKVLAGIPKYPEEVRLKALEMKRKGIANKEIQGTLGITKRSLVRIFQKFRTIENS